MTFTVLDVYKAGVPLGEPVRSDKAQITTTQTTGLTISATTSPENWAHYFNKLKVQLNAPVATGTGSGLLQVTYPDYVGENQNTLLFDDADHIKDFADEVIEVNSETQYVFNFQPPIRLQGSKTEKDLIVGLPDNRTLTSGDMSFLLTGWKIKESDLI